MAKKASRLANDLEKRINQNISKALRKKYNSFEAKLKDLERFRIEALHELKKLNREMDALNKNHLTELRRINETLKAVKRMVK